MPGSARERIEDEFDALATGTQKFVAYKQKPKNQVTVRIQPGSPEDRLLVSIALDLRVDLDALPDQPTPCGFELMDCWIYWRPNHRDLEKTRPIPVLVADAKLPPGLKQQTEEIQFETHNGQREIRAGKTHFLLSAEAVERLRARHKRFAHIKFGFTAFNASYLLDRPPYCRQTFSLGLSFAPACAQHTVMSMEHPSSLGMRVRRDNASFHSLPVGIEQGYQRRIVFFEQRTIQMRYAFGSNVATDLAAPGVTLVKAGLGILSAAIAVWLLTAHNEKGGAATFFVLSLGPWFISALESRRHFSASTIVHRTSASDLVFDASFGLYMLFLVFVGAAVVAGDVTWETRLEMAGAVLGLLLLGVGGLYDIAIWLGLRWLLRYACDRCERPMLVRRNLPLFEPAPTHWASRRTLCRPCYDLVKGADAVPDAQTRSEAAAATGPTRVVFAAPVLLGQADALRTQVLANRAAVLTMLGSEVRSWLVPTAAGYTWVGEVAAAQLDETRASLLTLSPDLRKNGAALPLADLPEVFEVPERLDARGWQPILVAPAANRHGRLSALRTWRPQRADASQPSPART